MPLTPPPSAPPAAPDAPGAAPSRSNPSTFRALADAFVQWLVTFRNSIADLRSWLATYIVWAATHVTELNALQTEVTTVEQHLDAVDSRIYPGTYAFHPTTRPDGTAIQDGDRYVNSADGQEYIRSNNVWTSAAISSQAAQVAQAKAEIAAAAAEAAVDVINTTGKVFTFAEGTAAGIAATTNGQSFAVLSADMRSWTVYRNNSGTPSAPLSTSYTSAYIDSLMLTISELNELALDGLPNIQWGIADAQQRVALALLSNGKMLLDIDPSSRGWAAIKQLMVDTGTGASLNTDNLLTGSTGLGSPATTAKSVYAITDPDRRTGLALLEDGTLWVAKYDANLQSAVAAAQPPTEFFAASGGQIVKYTGHGQTTLTSLGTNSAPAAAGGKVQFLSDRMRGLTGAYQMNKDGTTQRLLLGSRAYEVVFVTGQSLAIGAQASPALSTSAPYPTNALKLTGPAESDSPVLSTPWVTAPAAVLEPLSESAFETVCTSFAASLLDRELTQRGTLKQVLVGNGFSGAAYTSIKKGTATYNDVMAQIARVATFGSAVVRAGIIVHGEGDNTNVNYAANLIEWQADYEADIKAATGQSEPVYLLICQTASMRFYFPTQLTSHKSVLGQLEASETSSKIILAVPEYIGTYADDLHFDAASQRLMGEYVEKAYRAVCIEGRDWRGVSPKTYTLGADFIDIQFHVPVAPLVLDTALCTNPGNFGFTYSDASGRTITSVAVKAGTTDTVRIQLSGAIGASAVIDYAYSNGTAGKSGKTQGARGCLRDSDPAVSRWNPAIPLYNPCVIFRKTLN